MAAGHLISRVTILGTGLIGGSFALALRKYTTGMHISGWDRPDIVREAQSRGAVDEAFCGDLALALQNADLIYLALPIAATIDLLPEVARNAPSHALVTDACSTKVRIAQAAAELFSSETGPLFLGGHPMAGTELPGIASAATRGRGAGIFSLRSPGRKRLAHHACRPWASRFTAAGGQPLLHVARHRPHQPRSACRRAGSFRTPPGRAP